MTRDTAAVKSPCGPLCYFVFIFSPIRTDPLSIGKNGFQMNSLLVSDSNVSDSDEDDTLYDKRSAGSSKSLLGGQKLKA